MEDPILTDGRKSKRKRRGNLAESFLKFPLHGAPIQITRDKSKPRVFDPIGLDPPERKARHRGKS